MGFEHISVLLNETINGLNIKENGIYVDGTLGGGGHAYHVAEKLGKSGRLIGIDQDGDAIQAATKRLEPFADRVTIVRSNYENFNQVLDSIGVDKVDGIMLDLGVSSYQLDTVERGFTYKEDTALDMRMDTRNSMTAKDILNGYSEQQLFRVIRDYGEDKFAKNIAKHIVKYRESKEIETTGELVEIIKAVNPGGRLCIITFNSLEDRIVKLKFKNNENPCECPPEFPVCVCGKKSKGKVITRKPVLPSEEELEYNKRSKSAKLRIFEHC